ncbi:amino acid adenylation domain-containing protein, partial [Nocardioides sp. GXZ039]|uniref:amino acid adenylation domain-containing protein n=1 Tax=Nocardioides sp. GXZ039 TaxID=3136018 RepID=UPI0030F461F1
MRFPADQSGQPTVVVDPATDTPDLTTGLTSETVADEPTAWERARDLAGTPFDVATGPLVRWTLLAWPSATDDTTEHLLVVVAHHLITDGWSLDLLVGELTRAYHASASGLEADLPELPVGYRDFAHWQRERLTGDRLDQHVGFWRERLAGLEPLDLPTDHPRPPVQEFGGADHPFVIDAELAERLRDLARSHGATLYMVLLAAFGVVLGRWSRQDDVTIGSPIAGRVSPDVEDLIGMFVNLLTMRVRLDGDPSFADLLRATREEVLGAFDHQELPFEQLVGELDLPRDVSRSPLFQAVLTLQNFSRRAASHSSADLEVTWGPVATPATRFDLEAQLVEVEDGLVGTLTYSTALFDEETIARLAGHWLTVLEAVADDPAQPLARIPLVGDAERAFLLGPCNPAGPVAPPDVTDDTTLPRLVLAQIRRTPEAVALRAGGTSITYGELGRRAAAVATGLRGRGVGPDVLVGIACERSIELVVGVLGIHLAGGAYVPLDPEYPEERLRFMAEDAGFAVILTQRALLDSLPLPDGVTALALDDAAQWPTDEAVEAIDPAGHGLRARHAAYAIYTSGSTGRPKGVLNEHAAVVNRLRWMQDTYRLTGDDVVIQKTPTSFDVSVWELLWPIMTGATMVLADPGGHKDPAYLRELIVSEGITVAHFVPSMLRVFLDEPGAHECTSLRAVVTSGEELPVSVSARFLQALPGTELHNLYGPTEAAIDVSHWPVAAAELEGEIRVPIGRPIDNISLHVVDERTELVPVGIPGELVIGGIGVARGYLGRFGLSADRFVPDPYGPPGSRLYRTGDLVRRRPDGSLDFLGRLDDQVKLRGQRIELGEIQAVLREDPSCTDAVVVVREDSPGDQRLVAYVVPSGEATADELDLVALKELAKRRLPEYMRPQAIVPLDALPLSSNGKLDRRALPAPTYASTAAEYSEPATDHERLVARIWSEVLDLDRVGRDDDFFDLGGHSLLATQVATRLRTELAGTGVEISVVDLFQARTLRELAALMDAGDRGPRGLLVELTPKIAPAKRVRSYVCVPYGGGSAVVYQPLADALPAGHSLYAVSIPGHDVGLSEESLGFEGLVERCLEEVMETVEGPLVLYGHCGVGGAATIELARRLEASGREVEAVYIGAIFPFAKPKGLFSLIAKVQDLATNTGSINRLKSQGVDMDEIDPAQADRIISAMRSDARQAEAHFTSLLEADVDHLAAPVISVVGDRDPATEYFEERYEEWHFVADRATVVLLHEAGHFFLKYRAEELAKIVTEIHPAVERGTVEQEHGLDARGTSATWSVRGTSDRRPGAPVRPRTTDATLGRFLTVVLAQLISMLGSTLTSWAIPVWIFLETGSVLDFGLLWVVSMVPGLLVAPLAGAVVDRVDRRRVMLVAGVCAAASQGLVGLLVWADAVQVWHMYVFAVVLSVVLTFQRLAYTAAVPQLVPKRYLGYANGVLQLGNGLARVTMPILAAGLMAAIGLGGILLIDVVSYAVALSVLASVRFPNAMGWVRRESLGAEIREGFRYSWQVSGLRHLLVYSAIINIFLGALLVMAVPLVLSFGDLRDVGVVSAIDAGGLVLGGLLLSIWGGPRQRRVLGFLWAAVLMGAFAIVTGLDASVPVVAIGVSGTALGLAIHQGIGATIIQVKVPQRFHGRIFAINQMLAWSTLPIAFGVVAPFVSTYFETLLTDDGALAGSVGAVIGTGEGRGIALLYVVFGIAIVAVSLAAMCIRRFARFDLDTPDAEADDLVGAREARETAPELAAAHGGHRT